MINDAINDYMIEIEESILIGDKLTDIFTLDYPKLLPILNKCITSDTLKKKDICFLLEIAFRYNKANSFYPYDKIWLKYI